MTGQRARGTDWKPAFLSAFSSTGNVTLSAKSAGVSRQMAHKARKSDEKFADAWDESREEATDLLFGEARLRATQGREEPVFYKGEVVGHVRRYSDFLLWKLLCALRPEQFADRQRVEQTGLGGGPIRFEMTEKEVQAADREITRLMDELAPRREAKAARRA